MERGLHADIQYCTVCCEGAPRLKRDPAIKFAPLQCKPVEPVPFQQWHAAKQAVVIALTELAQHLQKLVTPVC